MRKIALLPILAVCLFLLLPTVVFAQELIVKRVSTAPVIDGTGDDSVWQQASVIVVQDPVAEIPITIKALYADDNLYLLAQFVDPDENRHHRLLHWDKGLQAYVGGPEREDCLVVKWNMSDYSNDLSLSSDRPYSADIWFWKAMRTDHAGFADDKMQIYSNSKRSNSKMLTSKNGSLFYLVRKGDKGSAAYESKLYSGFEGDKMPSYTPRKPSGSRADVKAKGNWQAGQWTVEFSRKLHTGHDDDVQFYPQRSYDFAVSRYEVAGRQPEPEAEQPLYGAGEVGELITLTFE